MSSAYAHTTECWLHGEEQRERREDARNPERRRALVARRAELEAALRCRSDLEVERRPDAMENAELEIVRECEAQEMRRRTESLRDVEAAIERLDAGLERHCEVCGGEIPEKRLEANPAAIRCRRCQEMHEARRAR